MIQITNLPSFVLFVYMCLLTLFWIVSSLIGYYLDSSHRKVFVEELIDTFQESSSKQDTKKRHSTEKSDQLHHKSKKKKKNKIKRQSSHE